MSSVEMHVEKKVTVTFTITGEQAEWLGAILGHIRNSRANKATAFFSELWGQLREAGIDPLSFNQICYIADNQVQSQPEIYCNCHVNTKLIDCPKGKER